MFSMNPEPLLKSIGFGTEPPTEELAADDEGPDFMAPKRRNRRFSKPNILSVSSSTSIPAKTVKRHLPVAKRTKTKSCSALEDLKDGNLFVDKLPMHVTKSEMSDVFSKFGKVTDIYICNRSPEHEEDLACNFAFVSFDSLSAAEAALAENDTGIFFKQDRVRVARRRSLTASLPKLMTEASLPKSRSNSLYASLQLLPKIGHEKGSEWSKILEEFDWQRECARYLFREVTMEDYFRDYVHTLASFRGLPFEDVEDLTEKLVFLSENRPKVLDEMMPPSISGLVCNQHQDHYFDVRSILHSSKELFRIEKDSVYYLRTTTIDNARYKLKKILLKGLFIYFFAKFSHGPVFNIKLSYYLKSEPIKSSLMRVMGLPDVVHSLKSFFDLFSQVFCFNEKKCELRLKVDFYNKSQRDAMREFLVSPEHSKNRIVPAMIESSDSSEEMGSSKPPSESDVGLPFSMDSDLEYQNLTGIVHGIYNENSGAISFKIHGQREVAFFCQKDFYINGNPVFDIWNNLNVGTEVHLDVAEDHAGPTFNFKATLIWIGPKPDIGLSMRRLSEDSDVMSRHDIDVMTHHICDNLEKLLEPAEIAQSITKMPCFDTPTDMNDLPDSVQSVVNDVLREDHGPGILSNPVVIDDLLFRLEPGLSLHQRNELKLNLEVEFRQVFAKYLVEHLHM